MKNGQRVVITGIGPLAAGGSGKEKVWKSIADKKTGLGQKEYKIGGESLGAFFLHEIKDFNIEEYGINKQTLNEIKAWKENDEIIDLYYFLASIKMALDDSGLIIDDDKKDAAGMILAHENMGLDHFYMKMINELSFTDTAIAPRPATKKAFLDAFYKKFHRTGYELQTFMSLFHTAKAFNIHGFSLIINNACASGLYALEAASCALRSGKSRYMIVAAVDHSSIFKQMWFNGVNMLAKDGRIKPFASDRDGFTIGEGGAALVLESMESALERKADIYAEYLSGSFVLEGWKVTYPDITNDCYKKAMINAIGSAGLKPSDIDLLIPHGVAANITDRYEAKSITGIFGKNNKRLVVSALKPYIGHTLGSTALLETAITLIGLKKNKIAPTLNCEKIDKTLGLDILTEMQNADNIKIAMKTACGFAGYDGACIFRIGCVN